MLERHGIQVSKYTRVSPSEQERIFQVLGSPDAMQSSRDVLSVSIPPSEGGVQL